MENSVEEKPERIASVTVLADYRRARGIGPTIAAEQGSISGFVEAAMTQAEAEETIDFDVKQLFREGCQGPHANLKIVDGRFFELDFHTPPTPENVLDVATVDTKKIQPMLFDRKADLAPALHEMLRLLTDYRIEHEYVPDHDGKFKLTIWWEVAACRKAMLAIWYFMNLANREI